jgi:hypothetical protein
MAARRKHQPHQSQGAQPVRDSDRLPSMATIATNYRFSWWCVAVQLAQLGCVAGFVVLRKLAAGGSIAV